MHIYHFQIFLSSTAFTLLSFSVPRCVCMVVSLFGQLFFVVEYLATQTGGATVNNIFEVILVEYLATI